MTEAEWRTCDDLDAMLGALIRRRRGGAGGDPLAGDRKARLFAVGCCRQIEKLIRGATIRRALEVAEAHADGRATDDELRTMARAARDAASLLDMEASVRMSLRTYAARDAAWAVMSAAEARPDLALVVRRARSAMAASPAAPRCQCSLLRCHVGPAPFRPVALPDDRKTPDVLGLARALYDDRAFDRLPILGDALEDAGCTDPDLLGHCRAPGEHSRGCWVVDLVLGRS